MYAVIACPKCRRPKGVELRHSAVTCPNCGKRLELRHLRILYRTDSLEELKAAVAAVAAKLRDGTEKCESLSLEMEQKKNPAPPHAGAAREEVYNHAALAGRGVRSRVKRVDCVATALSELLGEFSEEDLRGAFEAAGLDAKSAGKEIVRMLVEHLVYEPAPGRYRLMA